MKFIVPVKFICFSLLEFCSCQKFSCSKNTVSTHLNIVLIVDVKHVIMQLVEAELLESDSLETPGNINNNTMYISILGVKGGTSTTLLLQVLNTKDSIIHSNRAARMIGIYEGDKESRECIDAIFSGLINDIQDVCENIKEVHSRSHRNCPETSNQLNGIKSHN